MTKRALSKPIANLTFSYDSKSYGQIHADVGKRFGDEQRLGLRADAGDSPDHAVRRAVPPVRPLGKHVGGQPRRRPQRAGRCRRPCRDGPADGATDPAGTGGQRLVGWPSVAGRCLEKSKGEKSKGTPTLFRPLCFGSQDRRDIGQRALLRK